MAMKSDGIYLYNISMKDGNPLQSRYSCDLVFLCKDGKLQWLQMIDGLRLCIPRVKDNGEFYIDIKDFLANRPSDLNLDLNFNHKIKEYKLKNNIGEYYKYIFRPVISFKLQNFHLEDNGIPFPDCYDDISIWYYRTEYLSHIRQLELVIDDLKKAFQVVEPTKKNLKVFGNTLRNIILISCTEIDSMMSRILRENSCPPVRGMYKTTDYVKLKKALKLDKYKIIFNEYEDLGSFSPYAQWNEGSSTKSLRWYDNYNKIKHDRQNNFYLANLETALTSISAYAILLFAQFGKDNMIWKEHVRKYFNIQKSPQWHIRDYYVPSSDKLIPVNYPF